MLLIRLSVVTCRLILSYRGLLANHHFKANRRNSIHYKQRWTEEDGANGAISKKFSISSDFVNTNLKGEGTWADIIYR